MSEPIDKRRHYRPMALLQVKVLPGGSRGLPDGLQLQTIDVAVGGLRCASNVPLDGNTLLRLSLELVGGLLKEPETIVGDARVLRCTPRPDEIEMRRYDVALAFDKMSPQDKKRLQNYLNSL